MSTWPMFRSQRESAPVYNVSNSKVATASSIRKQQWPFPDVSHCLTSHTLFSLSEATSHNCRSQTHRVLLHA